MADELRLRGEDAELLEMYRGRAVTLTGRALAKLSRLMPDLSTHDRQLNDAACSITAQTSVKFVFVTNGASITPEAVRQMAALTESRGGGIACYLCDDPFNPLHRSERWLRALREYTLTVSTKRLVMDDLRSNGCRRVEYAPFAYHPPIHRPSNIVEPGIGPCDVAFAGNADKDRLPILAALVRALPQLSYRFHGHGWNRHSSLRPFALPAAEGLAYSAAMGAASVCPCLVRRANRDGHVMRSFELPAMGVFMLAERTPEHAELFVQGVHCDFWGDTEELIDKTAWYCAHPAAALRIARRGYEHITGGRHTYADRAYQLIDLLLQGERSN